LKPLNLLEATGRYEYTLVSGARVDALYGHVIIEYKAPGKLSSASEIQKAKEQVIRYIKTEAGSKSEWSRYLGVIISDRIAFVRYDHRSDTWILRGPYDIRREVIIKLIEALRGLRRKNLEVEGLVRDFGPQSPIARKIIKLLYDKLKNSRNPKVTTLFNDWMRLFKQATGYKPEELEELSELAREYGLTSNVDYDALIFAIHTYYALIMKLLAAEIAYLYGGGRFYRSYIAELDDAYARRGVDGVREALRDLEGGGIFKKLLNIENFLEGDYFSWYLEELDANLADSIAEMARRLADYEIATPQLEPEFARDLLKRLYQNLVPSDLRHKLGEYYTPDWLANLLLDEVGLSLDNLLKMGEDDPLRPLKIRVLDPACGSGTFLVLYISRLRRYAEEHFLTDLLLSHILENVVGYDLNPLAVLTARTNYLLAIADLLSYASGKIEIPVYLADSIMIERGSRLIGDVYILKTVVGEFQIPRDIVEKGLLPEILAEVSQALRNGYSVDEFKDRITYRFKEISEASVYVLTKLYEKLLELEKEGKDEVWISILRNAFAPILKGKFDYVVGNPPWVNWENLPETYREISKELWSRYGLLKVVKIGGFKRDLAMLFLARCFDLYLKEGGKLGFLVPFTAFKVQAGAGFREFLARKTRIHVIHDLVTLKPFEGAINMTAAVVVEKVCNLPDTDNSKKCPQIDQVYKNNVSGVRHIIWANPSRKPIPTDMPLEEVLKSTKRYEAIMTPIIPNDPSSPWMQTTQQAVGAIRKLIGGAQHYEAHAGVYVGLNRVYFIKILERLPNGNLKITNPRESGQEKEVDQIEAVVEPDLVYPLIRGKDVKRWYAGYEDRYVIVPHDPKTGKPLPRRELMVRYGLTYEYLNQFKEFLKQRAIKPFLSLRKKIKEAKNESERKVAESKLDENFYIIDNIGPYTFAPYKVVWKEIAQDIECAVIGSINSKTAIPDHKLMFIPLYNEDEAYYVCGILNSSTVRCIVQAYTVTTGKETHIADIIKIPRYDPKNELHRKISELAKQAHGLAKEIYKKGRRDLEVELRRVEDEIDASVAKLFGLSDRDLREFKRLLAILSGEELPEEEEVVVPVRPSVSVLNTLLEPGVESYVEVDVVNPSGEELELVYELPWGRGSFKIVEGRYRIRVPPLKPGKYKGVLRWVWRGEESSLEVVIEVSEPMGPRRRRTLLDFG